MRTLFTLRRSLPIVVLVMVSTIPSTAAERKLIQPEDYNRGLPFTPGILIDGTLYISGFSGEDPKTGKVPRAFEAEVKQALDKIGVILAAASMQYEDVVSVQVYLTDMRLFERMNVVYRTLKSRARRVRLSALRNL